MSLRANEYPRAAKILAALGLTVQLAAAATNGIPVAQQVTGVVARLVKLAEDIETKRDALHQLAETARKTGLSIEAVTAGRKLGEQVEHSLKGINIVCHAIEAVFAKHKAKHPMRKALSYALTTSKDVEALSQELLRASQQFELVTALDNNARLKEAGALQEKANSCLTEANARLLEANNRLQEINTRVQENSPYNGNFRNLHDCDVDKQDLIWEDAPRRSQYKLTYYTALVDHATCSVKKQQPVFVLRYLERKSLVTSGGKPEDDDWLVRRILECDRILEQFSTARNSHKNIARIYGRSQGDHFTNFTVLKSGYIPLYKVARLTASIERTWDMIVQIVDALCHIDERGAHWLPGTLHPIYVDDSGVPMIGLSNDLCAGRPTSRLWEILVIGQLLWDYVETSTVKFYPNADEQHAFAFRRTTRCSIPRRFIPKLNERISAYLEKALASCEKGYSVWMETESVALRAAASGRKVGTAFCTEYFKRQYGMPEAIYMSRVEESDNEIVYLETYAEAPAATAGDFRAMFGITLPIAAPNIKVFYSTRDPAQPSSMSFRPRPRW